MATDAHFLIGSSHQVCEDFSLAGKEIMSDGSTLEYAIVCDGCSSNKLTDVGARILCLGLIKSLKSLEVFYKNEELNLKALTHSIENSLYIKDIFVGTIEKIRLNKSALAATAIILLKYKGDYYSIPFGDGYVAHRYKSGKIILWKYEYVQESDGLPTNTPYYLMYSLFSTERDKYLQLMQGTVLRVRKEVYLYGICTETSDSFMPCTCRDFKQADKTLGDDLLLGVHAFSDGLGTFSYSGKHPNESLRNTKVPESSLIESYTFHPNPTGEFVKRDMLFLKKNQEKQFMTHSDDFSMAAIHE